MQQDALLALHSIVKLYLRKPKEICEKGLFPIGCPILSFNFTYYII